VGQGVIAVRIPVEYAPHILGQVWLLLVKACTRGCDELDPADLAAAILAGEDHLWVMAPPEAGPVAVGVTRILPWRKGLYVRVLTVGGERPAEWIEPFREALRTHAKEVGAVKIVTEARPGWAPIFHDLKPKRYIYEETIG
jgi:hypothetical protein